MDNNLNQNDFTNNGNKNIDTMQPLNSQQINGQQPTNYNTNNQENGQQQQIYAANPQYNINTQLEKNDSIKKKKEITDASFFFHYLLSFILWNLVFGFLYKLINRLIIKKIGLFGLLETKYLIILNLLWIISSVLTIFVTYYFNRNNTTRKGFIKKMKLINFVVFTFLTLGINGKLISSFYNLNKPISIIFTMFHIVVIYFLNDYLFKKYNE